MSQQQQFQGGVKMSGEVCVCGCGRRLSVMQVAHDGKYARPQCAMQQIKRKKKI